MRNKLFKNKIEVRKSSIQGYGVFATRNIKKDDIIEECHLLLMNENPEELANYTFDFSNDHNKNKSALALGFGSLYNHSETPNADYYFDPDSPTITFKATQNIQKDEEILVSYGKDWFKERGAKMISLPKPKNKLFYALVKLGIIILFMLMFHLLPLPHFSL